LRVARGNRDLLLSQSLCHEPRQHVRRRA
jgi:hypothetical protein